MYQKNQKYFFCGIVEVGVGEVKVKENNLIWIMEIVPCCILKKLRLIVHVGCTGGVLFCVPTMTHYYQKSSCPFKWMSLLSLVTHF